MNEQLFKTLEKILKAETSDLRELAKIAEVDPKEMYATADLSGTDLRAQDISFLVGLNAQYHDAVLTSEQRKMLDIGTQTEVERTETARKISSVRISIVSEFITAAANVLSQEFPTASKEDIEWTLSEMLLSPIEKNASRSSAWQFGPTYVGEALIAFSREGYLHIRRFTESLFTVFGKVRCGASLNVADAFDASLPNMYSYIERMELLARWKPNLRIVLRWVEIAPTEKEAKERAIQASRLKNLSFSVIAELTQYCSEPTDFIEIFERRAERLTRDEWERLSFQMVNSSRLERHVTQYLHSDIHQDLKQVLIRQFLARGRLGDIQAVVNWLETRPQGLGGIAISNAISATNQFGAAYEIAKNVGRHLGSAQRHAMFSALEEIAATPSQHAQIKNLKKRFAR